MKYLFFNKRIASILLFYFSMANAQKIIFINNTDKFITIKNGTNEIIIKDHKKKELVNVMEEIMLKEINRAIYLFLEPTEKLTIVLEKDNKCHYIGDHAKVYEYINGNLNIETFGKLNDYIKAVEKKNFGELNIYSELLLLNILKKINQTSILPSEKDSLAIKKMKSYIKYNWLMTIISAIEIQNDKGFTKQALSYYYKKYLEVDIPLYKCWTYYHYRAIEALAKKNDVLQIKLPIYSIIEKVNTTRDNIQQFLPKNCQKYYFSNKYNYLDHISSPEKEHYKKILNEKFNN